MRKTISLAGALSVILLMTALNVNAAKATFGHETLPSMGYKSTPLEVMGQSSHKQQPRMVAGDGTVLYGQLCYSDLWEVEDYNALAYGVYSFPAQDGTSVTEVHPNRTNPGFGGGAYHDGKLYYTSYSDGPEALEFLYFCILDVNTWEVDLKAIAIDLYSSIGLDMTFDPVTEQLFSISYTDYEGTAYTLSTINVNTGLATEIAPIVRMHSIAADVTGQLYGVRYSDGMFCKIDKETAELTPVGDTGIDPINLGSATFDDVTGKLYMVGSSRESELESGLYEIDITTGKASLVSKFPNAEMFTCLYIPRAQSESKMGDIKAFTTDFITGESTGTISVTAPSTDVDGNAITGNITITVYDNENFLFSRNATAGETITQEVTFENGLHKLEAMASHATLGKSKRAECSIFIGTDGPAAVKNLTLTKEGTNTAVLTWETPTIGQHGGEIKPNMLYYTIYRNPGNIKVAEDVDGTTWSQTFNTDLYRYYSYVVVGHYKGVEGEAAESNQVTFGTPKEVPYTNTFDTDAQYLECVMYNENNDKGYWGYQTTMKCAAYKYDTFNQADDYLVLPGMQFKAGQSYKLKYNASSMGDFLYPESMEIVMGRTHNPEDLTTVIDPVREYPHVDMMPYEVVIDGIKEDGAYFVAFRARTEKGQYYLYVDDVEIVAGPTSAAPGLVENLTATPQPNAALATKIEFNAPSKDFSGNALTEIGKITISRSGTVLTEFTNPAPGAKLEYIDNAAVQGLNTYTIIASNASGDGNPIEVACWAGADVPGLVVNATHTTINEKDAIIKWEAPVAGVNGGSLDYSKITYTIKRNDNVVVAEGITETTFTDVTIDTSVEQKNVLYLIAATNDAGTGDAVQTGFYTYGTAFVGGFHESFTNGAVENRPWVIEILKESLNPGAIPYWKVESEGTRPVISDQDGTNGMLTCYRNTPGASSRAISPKISTEGMKNPVVSFWMYHYYNPDSEWNTIEDVIQPEIWVKGVYSNLTKNPLRLINGRGWYKYEVLLTDYVANADYYKLAFLGTSGSGNNMSIDNITVYDTKDNDLKIETFTGSAQIAVGTTRSFIATVYNAGAQPASGYTVVLYRDNEVVAELNGTKTLAFAETEEIAFEVTASIADAGNVNKYHAEIVYAADQDVENNKSVEVETIVPAPNYPIVEDLTATQTATGIELSWSEPMTGSSNVAVQGFEDIKAFSIETSEFGAWNVYDNDALQTYGISKSGSEEGIYEYPNACYQMAFMAFNPEEAGIDSELWTPYSGNQMAVSFASVEGQNDDWLISPEIVGGSEVSFYAKSPSLYYGEEEFYFCYTTEVDPMIITNYINLSDLEKAPTSVWTKYTYTLPENATYFAIHAVSNNRFALFIDEVTYEGKESVSLELQGFKVYRDKALLVNGVVEDFTYTDVTATEEGRVYTYNVSTLYDKGESALSNTVSITSGIENVSGNLPLYYVNNGVLYIKDVIDAAVTVCAMNGVTYYNQVATENLITLSLPAGIYAVSINGVTGRVIIK